MLDCETSVEAKLEKAKFIGSGVGQTVDSASAQISASGANISNSVLRKIASLQ